MGYLTLIQEFAKPVGFALVIALSVFGGWKLNTYYTGYELSIAQKVQTQVDNAMDKIQQDNAKNFIDTKRVVEDNATKIVETQVPVIVERTVYKNICLDQDGVDILEKLKINSTEGKKKLK